MLLSLLRIIAAYLIVWGQRLAAFVDTHSQVNVSIEEYALVIADETHNQDWQNCYQEALLELGVDINLAWWHGFYRRYFDLQIDISVISPEPQGMFDWPLFIAKGLTIKGTLQVIEKNMKLWLYKDGLSDKDIVHNDRDPNNGSYFVLFRNRVEADEETKNLSADDLKARNISGITLLERLIMELVYWDKTEKHLDLDSWTLCSGSRDSDGGVPRVYWDSEDSELSVRWCNVGGGGSFSRLRARVAVSC